LPWTNFHLHANNPVAYIFQGRIPIQFATSSFYFTHGSLIQRLMHEFKYRGHQELGLYLGRLMGETLKASEHLSIVDLLIPLPLFSSKERMRGFNQATILCRGISEVFQRPILETVVRRTMNTESQTRKNRVERWQNMEGKFELINDAAIRGKHLLLIDDVMTTGATLESCGRILLQAEQVQLSIGTLCFSTMS
jgi:ComF family protein